MKIGLVGYQGSGKSTLFQWLTGAEPDPALAHVGQTAMAEVPDSRFEPLIEIYHPKKITKAAIELLDTPGLARDHQGNASKMGVLREADCLVLVVAAYDGSDPAADLASFDEDLLLADMEIVSNRLAKVKEPSKKCIPRAEQEKIDHERDTLQTVLDAMEAGNPLRQADMTDEQLRVTSSFRLLSEKPRIAIINTADDEEDPERFATLSTERMEVIAMPVGLEVELSKMSPEDRAEFEEEMGVGGSDRDGLVRRLMETAGYMVFFTAGEKEVRTWLLPQGSTALEAADGIHSDLARGFIRAETMTCSDLIRLGSERDVKAAGLVRQEPKDYVVKDDDILFIKFSV
ncbi:MAG: DUF933 domain-containing protein [Planctomycetia bacterium]|jgi:ribosome-binding ATPase YchF (GTP1/OBG family)